MCLQQARVCTKTLVAELWKAHKNSNCAAFALADAADLDKKAGKNIFRQSLLICWRGHAIIWFRYWGVCPTLWNLRKCWSGLEPMWFFQIQLVCSQRRSCWSRSGMFFCFREYTNSQLGLKKIILSRNCGKTRRLAYLALLVAMPYCMLRCHFISALWLPNSHFGYKQLCFCAG